MAKSKVSKTMRDRVMSSEEVPRVSFRFFEVTEGPLIDAMREISEEKRAAFEAAKELGKSFGASEAVIYGGRWLFGFEREPDDVLWKVEFQQDGHRYYKPVRRTLLGRRWADAIKKLTVPRHHDNALLVLNLPTGPAVIEGRHWYKPVVWGWLDVPLFLVKVPWRAYAPEILDAYRAMRAGDEYFSTAMDHALWVPHPTMREVQEWQALKTTAERNAGAA